jgi:hypothetical protein
LKREVVIPASAAILADRVIVGHDGILPPHKASGIERHSLEMLSC